MSRRILSILLLAACLGRLLRFGQWCVDSLRVGHRRIRLHDCPALRATTDADPGSSWWCEPPRLQRLWSVGSEHVAGLPSLDVRLQFRYHRHGRLILKAHRLAQREAAFKKGRPVPELCFTSTRPGRRLDPHYVLHNIVPHICAAPLADVPKVRRLTIHALRHTYVTQMLFEHGRHKLPYVSQQIGHRDVSTTENIYTHSLTEHHDGPPVPLVVEDL
jgi:Phage integrase family